jgi:hypothetical protein
MICSREELGPLKQIPFQGIVDVSCRDRGMAGSDGNLMKIRHDIADCVNAFHSGSLMMVSFKASNVIVPSS